MNRKIRAVFFDAGNTLLYLDQPFIVEQLSMEGIEVPASKVREAEYLSRRAVDKAMAAGNVPDKDIWPLYFNGILTGSGMADEEARSRTIDRIRERNDFFGMWTHVPGEVRETLIRLREEGYKIGIISNSDGSLKSLLEKTGVGALVDFALDSFVVGVEKPRPGIFKVALEKAGEAPQACIHVGDIEAADVNGALGVGIHPVLLDPGREEPAAFDVISSLSEIFDILEKLNRN